MVSNVEAHYKYGGLQLTCDEDTFTQLTKLVLADPSVAASVADSTDGHEMRFFSVRMPSNEKPSRFSWLALTGMILALCGSGVITLAGLYTIAQWVIRLVA